MAKVRCAQDSGSLRRSTRSCLSTTSADTSSRLSLDCLVLFAIPTLHILSARYLPAKAAAPAPLQITYLGPSVPHNLISLQLLPAQSSDEPKVDLFAFLETLQAAVYPRTKPRRRVYLVVNPVGGPGKARKMTQKVVLPALEAAGCTVTVVETRSSGQAIEFGRELDVDSYECVPARTELLVSDEPADSAPRPTLASVLGCVSGDGILHEVLNGLASRKDARRSLRLPLVPVPCGASSHGRQPSVSVKSTLNST
jgi:sphingosine kinase